MLNYLVNVFTPNGWFSSQEVSKHCWLLIYVGSRNEQTHYISLILLRVYNCMGIGIIEILWTTHMCLQHYIVLMQAEKQSYKLEKYFTNILTFYTKIEFSILIFQILPCVDDYYWLWPFVSHWQMPLNRN